MNLKPIITDKELAQKELEEFVKAVIVSRFKYNLTWDYKMIWMCVSECIKEYNRVKTRILHPAFFNLDTVINNIYDWHVQMFYDKHIKEIIK